MTNMKMVIVSSLALMVVCTITMPMMVRPQGSQETSPSPSPQAIILGAEDEPSTIIEKQDHPVVISTSPWTPALVTALFTGMIGLLGAITTLILTLRGGQKAAMARGDRLEVSASKIEKSVNGNNDDLRKRIASLSRRLAKATGEAEDELDAIDAEENTRERKASNSKPE